MKPLFKVEASKDFKKTHFLFWGFWTIIAAVLNISIREHFSPAFFAIRLICVNVIPFYAVYIGLKISKKGEAVHYPLRVLVLVAGMGLSYLAHTFYFFDVAPLNSEVSKTELTSRAVLVSFVANYIYFFLFGLMFYFFEDLVQKREEAKSAENRRLIAETAFLRAQINPHFLLNTLNFFYASATLGKSTELAPAILKLSDIMRYALTKGSNELILLREETRFISAYIDLNQLRFEKKLAVSYTAPAEEELEGIKVLPLVLTTLVENAFKHGELLDPEHPVKIQLAIHRQEGVLTFLISNQKKTGPKERGHGIGIENILARLKNEYGTGYQLSFEEDAYNYQAHLQIPLKTV